MRFAEDTLLLPPREDGESEEGQPEAPWPLPGGRQRLIRKDTPHYKKHFKISKLPQPEAVVALLQGAQPDGEGPAGPGGWHNGLHTAWAPRDEEEGEKEEEEEEAEEEAPPDQEEAEKEAAEEATLVSAPSIKVGLSSHTRSTQALLAPAGSTLLLSGPPSTLVSRGTHGSSRLLPKGCCPRGLPGLGSDLGPEALPAPLWTHAPVLSLALRGLSWAHTRSCLLPGDTSAPQHFCASDIEVVHGERV